MAATKRRQTFVVVPLTAEETARIEYAASHAAQGPLGAVDPSLLRRLEQWARREQAIRAHLDRTTLEALLGLAPLFTAYWEHRRETETLYWRAAPPPDEAAASLEARLRAALHGLEVNTRPVSLATSTDSASRPNDRASCTGASALSMV